MKINLKPISHREMGVVHIDDTLFAIGRREEPFVSNTSDSAARLSRRHARIFQEGGKAYVVDLGSLNGTYLNNALLHKDAVEINDGDELNLGGEFSFTIELIRDVHDDQTLIAPRPPVCVTLTPLDMTRGLETIVVERFPFLITRNDELFARFKDHFASDVEQVSRRHAIMTLKGRDAYVEDLDSANGTFISGERLDEHSKILTDGDTIAFGNGIFRFTVGIDATDDDRTVIAGAVPQAVRENSRAISPQVDAEALRTQPPETPETITRDEPESEAAGVEEQEITGTGQNTEEPESEEGKTRFVNSATSFLDVYLRDEPEAGDSPIDEPESVDHQPAAIGSLGKTGVRVGALRQALGGGSSVDRKLRWSALGAIVLVAGAAIGAYLLESNLREVKALFDDGAYLQSAAAANRHLGDDQDNDEIALLGEKALMKAVVPSWIEFIAEGDHSDAAAYLTDARERHPFIRRGVEMIDLLLWIGRVEAHMTERPGETAPIVLFQHEQLIAELVKQWDSDTYKHRRLSSQIAVYSAPFDEVMTRAFSNLRLLRNDNSLYGKAITDLKTDVRAALESNDVSEVRFLLTDFKKTYPRVEGVDALEQDVGVFARFLDLIERRQINQLAELRRSTELQTPLFEGYIGGWLDRSLPSGETIARYDEASGAWRLGQQRRAIEILESLTDETWGDLAARRIAHYKKIGDDFAALERTRETSAYGDQLLAFWSTLSADDEYFAEVIKPDFQNLKEDVLEKINQSTLMAKSEWDAFQKAGGISSMVRIEDHVSNGYKDQARRLSTAYQEISRGLRMAGLINVPRTETQQNLSVAITGEAERQKRRMSELHIVLEPALLKTKLDLLPQRQEQSQ